MSAIHAPKKKYFTVQQANAMLPLLRLILRDITTLAQRLREQNRRLARLQDAATATTDQLDDAVAEIESTQEQIRTHKEELDQLQVELKDYLTGLVDFPARMDGREVYLCWRMDEPEVAHWHDLDSGFAGRRKLNVTAR
jgi:hypothetical protein